MRPAATTDALLVMSIGYLDPGRGAIPPLFLDRAAVLMTSGRNSIVGSDRNIGADVHGNGVQILRFGLAGAALGVGLLALVACMPFGPHDHDYDPPDAAD